MNSAQSHEQPAKSTVVLICHENDPIDREGVAEWLASSFVLGGIVLLRDRPSALWRRLRQEYRRVGLFRLFDVLLFRCMYRLRYARTDAAWVRQTVATLRRRYPADLTAVPQLLADDPNSETVRAFIAGLQPDFVLARCKFILQPRIFTIARLGTYALHPGICPLYRNAHGCFWALVNRDLAHVGMTMLKVDSGIDTGPVYLQSSYAYDERTESHIVIQHRVVLENLDAIAGVMRGISNNTARPAAVPPRRSLNWGQPWLTAYLHWQRCVRGAAA